MYKQLVLILIIAATFLGAKVVLADAGQFKLDMIMAKRGDAGAQFSVAIAFEDGVGTKKDEKQAFDWYSKAAKQGHEGAQYKMGTFYEQGRVVKKDPKAAMEWYKQAADNGSRQAKKRMSAMATSDKKAQQAKLDREKQQREAAAAAAAKAEQEKQTAAKAEQQRQAAAAKEKARKEAAAKEKARKEAAARAKALKEAAKANKVVVVATTSSKPKAKPKAQPKRVDIPDIMDVVVKNNWKSGSMAADYLPSTATQCAKAGKEVICFSDERARIVGGKKVTYTAKATLNNFKRDGTFRVSYVYNAIKLDATNKRAPAKDAYGLRAQQGWQEPQLVVDCKTTDRKNLYCTNGQSRFHYVR